MTMLSKDYYWRRFRELREARRLLAKVMNDNLLNKIGCTYLENDGYNGIISTCKMLTREISKAQEDAEEAKKAETCKACGSEVDPLVGCGNPKCKLCWEYEGDD
jgi:hypothetical protein